MTAMKRVLIGLVLLGMVGCTTTPAPQKEVTPAPAPEVHHNRYQIIQSDLAARWTFRLDRFTGEIAQLVQAPDQSLSWQAMQVLQPVSVAAPTYARFEMFTSKLAVKFTFIIDTETGKTWQLVSAGGEGSVWQPL